MVAFLQASARVSARSLPVVVRLFGASSGCLLSPSFRAISQSPSAALPDAKKCSCYLLPAFLPAFLPLFYPAGVPSLWICDSGALLAASELLRTTFLNFLPKFMTKSSSYRADFDVGAYEMMRG